MPSPSSVLIQSAHHSAQLVEAVRKDILTKQMHFQPDLTIACAGGERVKTYRYALSMFSKQLRTLFASVLDDDVWHLHLPDFGKVTVESLVNLLQIEVVEYSTMCDGEVVELSRVLGIDTFDFIASTDKKDADDALMATEFKCFVENCEKTFASGSPRLNSMLGFFKIINFNNWKISMFSSVKGSHCTRHRVFFKYLI